MAKLRVGILISGHGTNMAALIEAARAAEFPAEVACVVSNLSHAPGVAVARSLGTPTFVLPHRDFADRDSFDRAVSAKLEEHGVSLVALAGFMRILSPWFPGRWPQRMINIHPSLLPAFPGLHVHERVLKAGVRLSGCTVHVVTPDLDGGPIVAQAAVPVLPGDSAAALAARVRRQEHRLYPTVVRWYGEGRVAIVNGRVTVASAAPGDTLLFSTEP